MRRRGAGGRVFLLLLLSWLVAAPPAAPESRVLPHLSFRVLRTPHFRIYYHRGEERLARSLAGIAESVHATLPPRLGLPAPALTHVLLVNQDDEANGSATPVPYNLVTITAVWPAASEILGNTNEWLRLVFTHEYTHVLHLHQSHGWARAARAVFGRAAFAFPNMFLPEWQVEGLATFEETRLTGQGRLTAGDARAVVGERTRAIGRERLDRVNGGQVSWPGGLGPYLYGGFFTEYLAGRFGEQKLGELARRSSRRLPYLASPAFRATFGAALGDLWNDYQRELREAVVEAPSTEVRRLTRHGFQVTSPRFTADGARVIYGTRNPHDLPAVVARDVDGAAGRREQRIAIRYGGEQVSLAGGLVFYDQGDYEGNVAWRSDLYAADPATGRVQRLTRGARLLAPDVSPDGRLLACIRVARDGTRTLVVFRVTGREVGRLALVEAAHPAGDGGAAYGSPRWSPDGVRLAVERRSPGGASELVVFDAATRQWKVAASSSRGRSITPTWEPDGRSLIFASDRDGGPFAVYRTNIESGDTHRVLAVPGGALAPVVSPDGRRLVFVGYTAEGYDLFEASLSQHADPRAAASSSAGEAHHSNVTPNAEAAAAEVLGDGPYRPWRTLLPRAWYPAADDANGNLRLGLSTGGADLLARHLFGVAAMWRVRGGEDAMAGPHRARPDWSAYYAYDRWRPTFYVAASGETQFLRQHSVSGREADAELQETSVSLGASVPFVRAGRQQAVQAAFVAERDTLDWLGGRRVYSRNAVRTGWAFTTAHLFGYSVSPEQGVSLGVTSEQVRRALGADGDADGFSAEARGYLRLGGRHSVLAVRVAAGAATGDAGVARVFYLGGPGPAGGLVDFGSRALDLLRGFADQEFAGRRIAVANVEYRFPLWRIERGRGTWPLFLRTLHAALFVDAGNAWTGGGRWADTKTSVGAEISLDAVAGFALPFTLSAGAARPHDGARFRAVSGYLRIGRAF